jgi:hypothetical protein
LTGICTFCGRPVHHAKTVKGVVVHSESLAELKVTPDEYARVMESAELNKTRDPQDKIYGLALHQPTMERI